LRRGNLFKERELLLELFKEAKTGNLDKAALFAKDPFKSVRDEIASSSHEVVPQLNEEFDYILATIINAGIICSGKMQQADLLKAHISLNYFNNKFRSIFSNTDFELLQFEVTTRFYYLGNIIIVDLIFISIIEFLLNEIRKTGSGEILISDEDWGRKKIIEFQCTTASSKEATQHVFDNVADDGIDFAFCKKAMQLFRGDMKATLNNKDHIIFTLTLPEI